VELYLCSPNTFSWRGAQLKKSAGNLSFIIIIIIIIIVVVVILSHYFPFLGSPRRRWDDNIRMDLEK
jgi:flagellar basal body-associated protein FliL